MKRMVIGGANVYKDKGPINCIEKFLPDGEVIELGNICVEDNLEWIEVIEDSRIIGYLDGNTELLNLDKYCFVTGDMLISYVKPDFNSHIAVRYKHDEQVYPVEKLTAGGSTWLRIYDIHGNSGYIPGESNIKSCEFSAYNANVAQEKLCVYKRPHRRNPEVLTTLSMGMNIVVTGIEEDEYKNFWLKIITDGKIGYIPRSARLSEGSVSFDDIKPSSDLGETGAKAYLKLFLVLSPYIIGIIVGIAFIIMFTSVHKTHRESIENKENITIPQYLHLKQEYALTNKESFLEKAMVDYLTTCAKAFNATTEFGRLPVQDENTYENYKLITYYLDNQYTKLGNSLNQKRGGKTTSKIIKMLSDFKGLDSVYTDARLDSLNSYRVAISKYSKSSGMYKLKLYIERLRDTYFNGN